MNGLQISDPQKVVDQITVFLQRTFAEQKKSRAVVAVSGGIDSALSLTLVTRALGTKNVTGVLMPHHLQPMHDAHAIVEFLQLPTENRLEVDILPMVDAFSHALGVRETDVVRRGNLKARCRMICAYDVAKRLGGLVCGTENKSEHYLGYFTRFGDAASDVEPIASLYKTQVRQLAAFLGLPSVFLEKAPSAGLWLGQTDEAEMGFSYEQADKVLYELVDLGRLASDLLVAPPLGIPRDIAQKVLAQVEAMNFKLKVPYEMGLE